MKKSIKLRNKKSKKSYKNKSKKSYKKTNKSKKSYKSKKVKGGAPNRVTVNSYMELANIIKNIPDGSRIWVVKKGEHYSLYESNKKDIIESLYSHGITKDNISEFDFNIL
jgi:hypothetical protein